MKTRVYRQEYEFLKTDQINAQEDIVVYEGVLGSFYSQTKTTFKVYSSSAASIKVKVEGIDNEKCPQGICDLIKESQTNNVWVAHVTGDLLGK